MREDLGHRSLLEGAAPVDDDHLVGEHRRLLGVVGDQHRGQPGLALQAAQLAAQPRAHGGVQGAEGLVEKQQRGAASQRPSQGHPALLASGELPRETVLQAAEPEPLEPPASKPGIRPHREVHLLAHRTAWHQG